MRFSEWFDTYSPDHMQAYEQLCTTGSWPDGFIPADCDMGGTWLQDIHSKMAQAWLSAMKHGQIIGSLPLAYAKNEGDQQ